jgi:molybdenum cofactor synthesis domain-containing protein
MEGPMRSGRPVAAALVVGSEILSGRTKDTNTQLLIETLLERGVRLRRWIVFPDEANSIKAELARLIIEGFDPIFVSGGMGQTHDDITVNAIAQALSLPLFQNPASERRMLDRWHRLNPGKELPVASVEGIMKMSTIPEGFGTIPNDAGMAEGLYGKVGSNGQLVIILPGVPKEYRAILQSKEMDAMLPRGEGIHMAEIELTGRESQVAKLLKEIQDANPDIEIGSYPQGAMSVIIRLTGNKERVRELDEELKVRLKELTRPI